ncbi:UNVERIFIED_CONTAM: hypothetical protein GTU68_029991 [Idotea baltica]|nr:hypothetical protein [Idotea baltica]
MIVITGAAGFIGSYMVGYLNEMGETDLILVDDFSKTEKDHNLANKSYSLKIDRTVFIKEWSKRQWDVRAVIHLGARTDTSEMDKALFTRLNIHFSQLLWEYCTMFQAPLIYASSAATYGSGKRGFSDDHDGIPHLEPLNPYGWSKQEVDKWILKQDSAPPFWAGLKFFNVYGPNEYHKSRMASVIFHAFHQIKTTGAMKLFRSHRPDFADGAQSRDFIYVRDIAKVIFFLLNDQKSSGIYNLGTGQARSFYELVSNVFINMELPAKISFIDTPLDIRNTYQYFTEAEMSKLRDAGYVGQFTSLEAGISDYVRRFLNTETHY